MYCTQIIFMILSFHSIARSCYKGVRGQCFVETQVISCHDICSVRSLVYQAPWKLWTYYMTLHYGVNIRVCTGMQWSIYQQACESRDLHSQKPATAASPSDKRVSPIQHFSSYPGRSALLHLRNVQSFVIRQFPSFQAWWLIIHHKWTGMSLLLFQEKNFFKIAILFGIFPLGLCTIFLFYVEKKLWLCWCRRKQIKQIHIAASCQMPCNYKLINKQIIIIIINIKLMLRIYNTNIFVFA